MRSRFTNHNVKYDTVHTINYDSHAQYFAGRVHLRSLVFLSARAARACRTRPRAQFSLVWTDNMCYKYIYRSHSARHDASRTLIFFSVYIIRTQIRPLPPPPYVQCSFEKISELYGRSLNLLYVLFHIKFCIFLNMIL